MATLSLPPFGLTRKKLQTKLRVASERINVSYAERDATAMVYFEPNVGT